MITITAIGKKHEDWVLSGIERYEKRLKPPYTIKWELLPHSSLQGESARQEESERIRRRLLDNAHVILLDERGTLMRSDEVATTLEDLAIHSRDVNIIIGGAFGVDTALSDRVDTVMSLSRMVFPHQLVRLILTEQLYRAQEISRGGKYHHE